MLFVANAALAQSPTPALSRRCDYARLRNSHRLAEARAREEGAKAAATPPTLPTSRRSMPTPDTTRTNHVLNFGFPRPDGAIVIVFPDIPDNFTSRVSFQWPIYTSGRSDALERAAIAEAQAAGADIETDPRRSAPGDRSRLLGGGDREGGRTRPRRIRPRALKRRCSTRRTASTSA